jgi:predicted nucleotidyltransferase
MLDKAYVEKWLAEFLAKLRERFGDRLIFVVHHGSWARGEARPESDIDCAVVLDRVEDADLATFRDIISSMPDAQTLASGGLVSVAELKLMPRSYLLQLFYGCEVLHGSIEGVVSPPTQEDLIEDVKLKADDNLHAARHYLLFPHELSEVVHKLKYHFKNSFYALQSWYLISKGEYISTKDEIIDLTDDPVDEEVVRVARDWYKLDDDLTQRPDHYIELLERWSRGMIVKLESFLSR